MPPAKPTTKEMGDKHEKHCAEVFGGHQHKGSGSQWDEQADGSNRHDDPLAFRWDAKSTLAKSHTITRAMLGKLKDQSHGERPLLPLCWYDSTSLDFGELWTLIQDDDLAEVLTDAREAESLRARVRELETSPEEGSPVRELQEHEIQRLTGLLAEVGQALADAQAQHDIDQGTIRALQEQASGSATRPGRVPDYVPRLPWVIVSNESGQVHTTRYGPDGARTEGVAATAVVERSLGSGNRPRLVLDSLRIPYGSLYVDGHLVARVCEDDPSLEMG